MNSSTRARRSYAGRVAAVVTAAAVGLGLAAGPLAPLAPAGAEESSEVQPVVAPGMFAPLSPTRLLDTRTVSGARPAGVVPAGESVTFPVTGQAGIPESGVAAVVLTVTATRTRAAGHVTAYPAGAASVPTASSLNFAAGQTVANAVTVQVGTQGEVTIANGAAGNVDLIVDVAGWYADGVSDAPGGFTSLAPSRLLDTRSGLGQPAAGTVPAGGSIELQVAGTGAGVPEGAGAVVLNVTATRPLAAGHVTVHPAGSAAPTASNLNFVRGQTVANAVTVKVGAGGKVRLVNGSTAPVHLLADVAGWFSPTSEATPATAPGAFTAVAPSRLLDTRQATKVPARGSVQLRLTGALATAGAVVLNVTATRTTAAGHVTAYPSGTAAPTASHLNFAAGQTVPGQVTVKVGADGRVTLLSGSSAPIDLVVDVNGSYAAEPVTATPGTTTRVSVDDEGREREATSGEVHDLTPDGRYVLFTSDAGDLDAGAVVERGEPLLYVRDTVAGTTDLVTVGVGGAAPDRLSGAGSISDDGRYVAFESDATNLVAASGERVPRSRVYVRDRTTGTTTLVRGNGSGAPELDGPAGAPDISGDGTVVAFSSTARNVVPGNAEPAVASDVYVWDRVRQTSTVVPDHPEVEGQEDAPSISADGRLVAFTSAAPLDRGDTDELDDVYVHDRVAGTTVWVSSGVLDGARHARAPRISSDGTQVVWGTASGAVLTRDVARTTAPVELVAGGPRGRASVSGDGAWVAHEVDEGAGTRVRVVELETGTSVEVTGQDADAATPVLDGTGAAVAFASTSSTLVADDTNGTADVFVRRRG